jgi:hypothetical protein
MSDPNVPFAPSGNPTATVSDNTVPTPATATPVAPPTGVPASPAAPAQPPATGGVPPGYVPSFRIRETRDQYEAKLAQVESQRNAEIERLTKQVQALTGVTPQNRSEEEVIREQLFKVVPDLKELIAMREQLAAIASQKDDFQQQTQHYWDTYNRTQMDRLYKAASASFDGQPLSDSQKAYIKSSFVGWASSDPQLADRYQTDPTLVDQFWKEFSSSFIDPVRRGATVTATGRAASNLPQDTPSGGLRTGGAPPEPADLDGRVDRAWQAFTQIKNGGSF